MWFIAFPHILHIAQTEETAVRWAEKWPTCPVFWAELTTENQITESPWVRTPKLPGRNEFHIVPQHDSQEHEISHTCSCGPSFDVEERNGQIVAQAVVHKPWDGRPGPLEG